MSMARGNRIGFAGGAVVIGALLLATLLTSGNRIELPFVGSFPSPVAPLIEIGVTFVSFFGIGVIIGLLVLFVFLTSLLDDLGDTMLGKFAAAIQAGGIFLAGWAIWTRFDTARAAVEELWYVPILLSLAWIAFVYFRHRQRVASASTAVDRTQRSIEREVADVSAVTVGFGVLILTFVVATVNGMLGALSAFGGPLSMWAGELGYVTVGYLGFLQLGGSGPGAGLVPGLTPMQWGFVVLVVGGLALLAGDRG